MLDNLEKEYIPPVDDRPCCSKDFKIIISRTSRIKMIWDLINLILYLFSFFVVPYSIAFGLPLKSDPNWMKLEISLDIMILIDICANFVTDRDEDPGSVPTNAIIAKRYLRNEFKYDILSCLPDLIRTYMNCELDKGDNPWYWLKTFRFL